MARTTAGSAALVLVDGATPLQPESALFEAMIEGWRCQHRARRLSPSITRAREQVLRRFQAFTGTWPWQWQAAQLEAWVAQGNWAHSTIRGYQGSVALFLDYICDPRYGWAPACMERVGQVPVQICHQWNTATHVADYEGRPERRPLTRVELQALFDVADDRVADIARTGRKGWLAAFRDAALFKVVYAWGLRRREAAMLDVGDFAPNPAAPELGALGTCHVRFGKAQKGSPPRRRAVATVMPWAAEVLEQYIDDLRPHYGPPARGPALWLTERGGRISTRRIDERFAAYRAAAGLPTELSVHCLRHSYASVQLEAGTSIRALAEYLGHADPGFTLRVYTHLMPSSENRALQAVDQALADAIDAASCVTSVSRGVVASTQPQVSALLT